MIGEPRYLVPNAIHLPPEGASREILHGVMLTATGIMNMIFLARVVHHEKNAIWRAVGYSVLFGSTIGALYGISMILTEFVPKKS